MIGRHENWKEERLKNPVWLRLPKIWFTR